MESEMEFRVTTYEKKYIVQFLFKPTFGNDMWLPIDDGTGEPKYFDSEPEAYDFINEHRKSFS